MLRPRIIPCLLVHNKGLVKTQQFKDPKYVGDPLNAVKIFNEKSVDELMVLDIDATTEGRGPDFKLIQNLASECRMPLCYGGGITSVEQAVRIINLGAEKVALSSSAILNSELLKQIGDAIGIQSVVVVLDVKKRKKLFGTYFYDVYTHRSKNKCSDSLQDLLLKFSKIGVGEIVINDINNDGMMSGYDIDLASFVHELIDIPFTFLGGAGSLEDLKSLIGRFKIIGAAAGSLFVFKGKYRAVLINYPSILEKEKLYFNHEANNTVI